MYFLSLEPSLDVHLFFIQISSHPWWTEQKELWYSEERWWLRERRLQCPHVLQDLFSLLHTQMSWKIVSHSIVCLLRDDNSASFPFSLPQGRTKQENIVKVNQSSVEHFENLLEFRSRNEMWIQWSAFARRSRRAESHVYQSAIAAWRRLIVSNCVLSIIYLAAREVVIFSLKYKASFAISPKRFSFSIAPQLSRTKRHNGRAKLQPESCEHCEIRELWKWTRATCAESDMTELFPQWFIFRFYDETLRLFTYLSIRHDEKNIQNWEMTAQKHLLGIFYGDVCRRSRLMF